MLALDLVDTRPQISPTQDYFHYWNLPNGTKWVTFHRLQDEYLIRFFDLADFILSNDGLDVCAYPVPGVSSQTIEHLYLNLVVPLALSHQYKLVLHGSAVEIDDFAVAFLAATGHGKSTLTASFSTSGYRFLSDDGLFLENINSQYIIQPNHPSIRLWDDSREALIPNMTCSAPLIDYTPKASLLADERVVFCEEARSLKNVYFLGECNTDEISIKPISGRDALIELHKHSFLLDMEELEMLTHHFHQLAELAKHPIFFRLEYPYCYDILPDVRESVVNHAENGTLP